MKTEISQKEKEVAILNKRFSQLDKLLNNFPGWTGNEATTLYSSAANSLCHAWSNALEELARAKDDLINLRKG